jgi:Na+/melibiose symporter-like transporter
MMGELFSSDVKGIAGSLTGTLNWVLAFVVTVSYPPLREAIGPSTCFIIFTVISVIGTLFSYFVVPETKGKSLSEIQEMLGEK